ncbi:MAG: hypothetical protein RIC03_03515 [Cyclobacteriaceae bacterium]
MNKLLQILSPDEILQKKELLNYIRSWDFANTDPNVINYFTKELKNILGGTLVQLELESNLNPLYRITVNRKIPSNNNSRIFHTSQLRNPPKKAVNGYGRANILGSSIFYAAFASNVAGIEIHPKKGDLITITKWIQEKPLWLTAVYRSGVVLRKSVWTKALLDKMEAPLATQFDSTTIEFYRYFMNILTEEFTKKVSETANLSYFLSASFANKILFGNGSHAEAIVYPSVKNNYQNPNIAIKPKAIKKLRLHSALEAKILNDPSMNQWKWNFEPTSLTQNIDNKNQRIHWSSDHVTDENILKFDPTLEKM